MPFAEKFLQNLEPFLFSSDGVPWGKDSVEISLSGRCYGIKQISQRQLEFISSRFGRLCRNSVDLTGPSITVYRTDPAAFLPVDFGGQYYTFDLDFRPGEIRLAGRSFFAHFFLDNPPRAKLWVPREDYLEFDSTFENVFRPFVAYDLLHLSGLLLHSAAVAKGGGAVMFFGRSGAGKSTISRIGLNAGFEVLSDDMNAVLPDGDGYVVEKLPFAGDLGQTATAKGRYPVRGLYWLEKAKTNRVVEMSPARAVSRLMACAAFVNSDPHRADRLAENLEKLVQSVPVRELHFNTDSSVWDLL